MAAKMLLMMMITVTMTSPITRHVLVTHLERRGTLLLGRLRVTRLCRANGVVESSANALVLGKIATVADDDV